ncbi:MAG: hypothetical protein HGB14_11465 [Anaerolineaceae bacterium]|nr:hypothetical protein [Anaerolineaceae bacterium]
MAQQNRSRKDPIIILFVLLIIVFISAAIYLISKKTSSNSASQKTVAVNKESVQQDFDDSSFEKKGKWYGLCKKNSIHSIADFKTTVSRDPVLKAHFSGFNWENAQTGKLEKATWAYVYYRKDDTIFRKKTPILLPAGDGYITDGITQIRTQCCNSYAAAPETDKSEDPELDANPSAGLPTLSDPFQDSPSGKTLVQYTSNDPEYLKYTPISGHSVVPPPPPSSPCPPCPCGESKPANVQSQESTPVIDKDNKTKTADQSKNSPIPDYCYCPECPPSITKPPPPPPKSVPEPFTIFLLGIGIGCLLILIFAFRKTRLHRG